MHNFQVIANLQSKDFAKATRSKIQDNWTSTDAKYYGVDVEMLEDHGTAHLCVIDKDGNAVSVTSTINFL